jgi:hypothetical protein
MHLLPGEALRIHKILKLHKHMITAKQIRMYEVMRRLSDEKEATEFVEGLQDIIDSSKTERATKDDIRRFKDYFDATLWVIFLLLSVLITGLYFMHY